jgi:hypothetical protein
MRFSLDSKKAGASPGLFNKCLGFFISRDKCR